MNTERKKILAILVACVSLALGAVYFIQNKNAAASANDGWKVIDTDAPKTKETSAPTIADETPENPTIKVYITGAVENPDVYELPGDSRVIDVLKLAGGATSTAALEKINLSEHLFDEAHIIVPHTDDKEIGIVNKNEANAPAAAAKPEVLKITKLSKININTASSTELQALSGIGQVTADKIIAYREEHGGFSAINDIMDVDRIGPKTFEAIKEYITVE